jgi:DNA-directed RNA polymerase specialized sigma24 family protein
MRIPDNMSEQEVVAVIKKVARSLAPKYTFAFYGTEDIEQEAFMMGMEALSRYDSNKPLENFLYTHIGNRLKNFKRDNYYRQDDGNAQKIQSRKKNLLDTAHIDSFGTIGDDDTSLDDVHIREIKSLIDENLPTYMRADYLRMCAGISIPKSKKREIMNFIKELLEEDETR